MNLLSIDFTLFDFGLFVVIYVFLFLFMLPIWAIYRLGVYALDDTKIKPSDEIENKNNAEVAIDIVREIEKNNAKNPS